jgi:hypothetical protein
VTLNLVVYIVIIVPIMLRIRTMALKVFASVKMNSITNMCHPIRQDM